MNWSKLYAMFVEKTNVSVYTHYFVKYYTTTCLIPQTHGTESEVLEFNTNLVYILYTNGFLWN